MRRKKSVSAAINCGIRSITSLPNCSATGPNQIWSWDITKLLGPAKWSYFYLYVIMDIFSRYVVGWTLARCESGQLARRLIRETCAKENIEEGQLTIHADRGDVDDIAHCGPVAGHLGCSQVAQPPTGVQRQSVLGKPLQNSQVPAAIPTAVWLRPGS